MQQYNEVPLSVSARLSLLEHPELREEPLVLNPYQAKAGEKFGTRGWHAD